MTTVCLAANCLTYPEGGGHLWAYLNWALGFDSIGCDVIWLEGLWGHPDPSEVSHWVSTLDDRLTEYGLAGSLAVYRRDNDALVTGQDIGSICEASDILIDLSYDLPESLVQRFPRSALLDIDPGLTQIWIAEGSLKVAPHDLYFTIGETVGRSQLFPDAGLSWIYTPPAVSLDHWAPHPPAPEASFTTVTHWSHEEWVAGPDPYPNNKRDGFLPFLELPRMTEVPLELAASIGTVERFQRELSERGWRTVDAHTELATPSAYHRYVQTSLGEFSCVKPSCVRLQNAWVSDRSLCYLASGKPVVIQNTGPSRFLPDDEGMLRFTDINDAARLLQRAVDDYDIHCKAARYLAENHFNATNVCAALLERAL